MDTLYVADTAGNRIVAIQDPSNVAAGAVTLGASGVTAGPASVVYSGAPLAGPASITSTIDGNLVVANNGASGNLLVELTKAGKLVGTLDPIALGGKTSPGGQIVTAVATMGSAGQQLIYFTDDSDGTVKVLSP